MIACPECRLPGEYIGQFCASCGTRRDPRVRQMAEMTEAEWAAPKSVLETTPIPAARFGEAPAVIGDRLRPHYDWALGEKVSSKSERRRKYAAAGLQLTSIKEYRRRVGTRGPEKPGTAYSYGGQKCRASASIHQQVT